MDASAWPSKGDERVHDTAMTGSRTLSILCRVKESCKTWLSCVRRAGMACSILSLMASSMLPSWGLSLLAPQRTLKLATYLVERETRTVSASPDRLPGGTPGRTRRDTTPTRHSLILS